MSAEETELLQPPSTYGTAKGELEGPLLPPLGSLSVPAVAAIAFKSCLGVALFVQPWATAQLGFLGAPLLLAVAALLALYTAQMVVTLRRAAAALPSVEDPALASLPALVSALLGGVAGALAELATAAAALGALATYLATAASFLAPLLPTVAPRALVWALAPAAAALCVPRSLEHAALIAVFGSAAALVAAVMLCSIVLRGWHAPAQAVGPFAESSAWAPLLPPPELPPAAAAAAAACCSAFALHYTVPALAAAMAQPRRCMEAVGRGWLSAAGVMALLGGVGGVALGRGAPRCLLAALPPGRGATLLRCLAALDLLYTAPLLARPGLLVVETALERGTGRRPGRRTAMVVRLLLVAGAAAAASRQRESVALIAVAGAAGCALLLPPLLLLLSGDGEGGILVRTSPGERAVSLTLALVGIAVVALALVGARDGTAVATQLAAQAPLGAPPAPVDLQPTPEPYDYVGDKPPVYAFKRQAVPMTPPGPVLPYFLEGQPPVPAGLGKALGLAVFGAEPTDTTSNGQQQPPNGPQSPQPLHPPQPPQPPQPLQPPFPPFPPYPPKPLLVRRQ